MNDLVAAAVAVNEKPTAIAKVNAAVASIKAIEVQIEGLAQLYGGAFDVSTPEGMKIAKSARRAVRDPRLEIERIRIEAKRDLLAVGKGLDKVAETLTAQILAIEAPIAKVIDAEEKRIEDEKQAAIAAEAKRVTDCRERIENIAMLPVRLSGKPAEEIRAALLGCGAERFDQEVFREMFDAACRAQTASMDALERLHAQRIEFEQQQAEAAELRKKQERADAIERERQAAETERAQKEAAEVLRIAAIEAQKLKDERAAFESQQAAESKRVADALALLDQQRREFEAQQHAEEEARGLDFLRQAAAVKQAPVTISLTAEEVEAAARAPFQMSPESALYVQSRRIDPSPGEIVFALAERFQMGRVEVLRVLIQTDWEAVRC